MTRIDDENPTDRNAVRGAYKGKQPECVCGRPATIWVRGHCGEGEMFLCDLCGLHLARIILHDLGHPKEIVRDPAYAR